MNIKLKVNWVFLVLLFILGSIIGFGIGYGTGAIHMASEGIKALNYVDSINIDINETEIVNATYSYIEYLNKSGDNSQ